MAPCVTFCAGEGDSPAKRFVKRSFFLHTQCYVWLIFYLLFLLMFITGAKKPAVMRFLRSRYGKIRSWLRQNPQLAAEMSVVGDAFDARMRETSHG